MAPVAIGRERWFRTASYGAVWHKADCGDRAICGTVLRTNNIESVDGPPPAMRHVSYICLKCYRIERGLEPGAQAHAVLEQRIGDLEVAVRALIRSWPKQGKGKVKGERR